MKPLSAFDIVDLFRTISARMSEARSHLGELDGAVGDADHGMSMADGFAAVVRASHDAAAGGTAAGDLFPVAAKSFLNTVGATTGPLYASAFLRAGQRFAGQTSLPPAALADLVAAMAEGIADRGKAQPGDKTMMDAWAPAARAARTCRDAGGDALAVLLAARDAAAEGRDATRAMVASKGRAARLGARSLGHMDPGAASAVIILAALHEGLRGIALRGGGVA